MRFSSKQIVEILSVIGVIASLLFVGMQLIFDRRVATGEMYASRSESRQANIRSMLESQASLATRAKVYEKEKPFWWVDSEPYSPSDATPEDMVVVELEMQLTMLGWDNIYAQYELGLFDEFEIEARRQSIKDAMSIRPSLVGFLTSPVTNYTRSIDWMKSIAEELTN